MPPLVHNYSSPYSRLYPDCTFKIKTQSITFLCSRSSWRRDYLERIKIIMDQTPLGLGLACNEQIDITRSRLSAISSSNEIKI
ncbi:unnamed protein product [Spirodela intermedia]|uniref:Uncharacterized protein n=1 Tax=Spirodela intermedia TaxID=51605 RepID=A0A7I8L216_SPIIN|nr:unnamed protein product [Spirodela intermedia]